MIEVLQKFPKLTKASAGHGIADPWVVALGRLTKNGVVVTKEGYGRSDKTPRIPDACDHFKVVHARLLDVIRNEGWTF